jgi:hypothetical protein
VQHQHQHTDEPVYVPQHGFVREGEGAPLTASQIRFEVLNAAKLGLPPVKVAAGLGISLEELMAIIDAPE